MSKNKYLSFFIILIITFGASFIGGIVTSTYKEPWYSSIIVPSFNPPSWVFGPVWSTLYLLMSIAIWRIWVNYYDKKTLKIYFFHLFFNALWSIFFFGFHLIGIALIDLLVILFFIIVLLNIYSKKDKISFYLMIPYFLWSSFALVLNTGIFFLNF